MGDTTTAQYNKGEDTTEETTMRTTGLAATSPGQATQRPSRWSAWQQKRRTALAGQARRAWRHGLPLSYWRCLRRACADDPERVRYELSRVEYERHHGVEAPNMGHMGHMCRQVATALATWRNPYRYTRR